MSEFDPLDSGLLQELPGGLHIADQSERARTSHRDDIGLAPFNYVSFRRAGHLRVDVRRARPKFDPSAEQIVEDQIAVRPYAGARPGTRR